MIAQHDTAVSSWRVVDADMTITSVIFNYQENTLLIGVRGQDFTMQGRIHFRQVASFLYDVAQKLYSLI